MNPALYTLSARGDDADVAKRAFGWSAWSDMPGVFYNEDKAGNQHRLVVGKSGWTTHHVRYPVTGETLVSHYSSLANALANQGMRSSHPVAPDYSDYESTTSSPHLDASWDAMKSARSRNARKLIPDLARQLASRGLIDNPRAEIRRPPRQPRGQERSPSSEKGL